jgi:hypothetical protein
MPPDSRLSTSVARTVAAVVSVDVGAWHSRDMPTDSENVCLSGKTGSHRRAVKMALLILTGYGADMSKSTQMTRNAPIPARDSAFNSRPSWPLKRSRLRPRSGHLLREAIAGFGGKQTLIYELDAVGQAYWPHPVVFLQRAKLALGRGHRPCGFCTD